MKSNSFVLFFFLECDYRSNCSPCDSPTRYGTFFVSNLLYFVGILTVKKTYLKLRPKNKIIMCFRLGSFINPLSRTEKKTHCLFAL